MLANKYEGQNVTGWLMSEKLDGVRAVWNGAAFVSRNGKTLPCPAEKLAQMPLGVVLDGELFTDRGQFQSSVGNIRSGKWDSVRFVIFDVIGGGFYDDRMEKIDAVTLPEWCEILEQKTVDSQSALDAFEASVLAAGGEGVMLRNPRASYEHKRSKSLLKLKRFSDAEAIVVDHEPGKGRLAGTVGALVVAWCGVTFCVGSGMSDSDRISPPQIGETITFSFFGLTDGGIPRHPAFVGVRDYE